MPLHQGYSHFRKKEENFVTIYNNQHGKSDHSSFADALLTSAMKKKLKYNVLYWRADLDSVAILK